MSEKASENPKWLWKKLKPFYPTTMRIKGKLCMSDGYDNIMEVMNP
ncbi:MAG: hypothetical protein QMD22_03945 [archaeon]|nr:hypothetical protein [archaeon]